MNGMQLPDTRFTYLIPNKVDEQYGCTVSTVGMQIISPDEDYPSKKHPDGYMFNPARGRILREYQLLYIVNGKGMFSNAAGNHEIGKGTVILLRPGVWHTYKPTKEIQICGIGFLKNLIVIRRTGYRRFFQAFLFCHAALPHVQTATPSPPVPEAATQPRAKGAVRPGSCAAVRPAERKNRVLIQKSHSTVKLL